MSPCRRVALSLAILLVAVPQARAHALHATCTLKGDVIRVEVFYSDNKPARDAKVIVRDKHGTELARGHTDDTGIWTFPRPAAGKYELTCDAGAGHREVVTITIPTETALKPMTPQPDEIVVTSGPTREELTRFPWLRLVLGVAAIGGLAVLLWLANRGRGYNGGGRPRAEG